MKKIFIPAAAILFAIGTSAQAQFLSNGDLETAGGTSLFDSWSNNAGVTLASQPIGGDSSARISLNTANTGNALNQNLTDPGNSLSQYSISFDFATSNPGSSTARAMQLNLRTVPGVEGGNINMRIVAGSVAGMGTIDVFGGGWQTVLPNVVNFSTSETGSGFLINSLTLDADYSAATPSYIITANGNSSGTLSFFQNSAPAQGDTLKQVSFQSGNIAAGAWSVVDNIAVVAVPEPGVLSLFALGGFGLLGLVRWRKN